MKKIKGKKKIDYENIVHNAYLKRKKKFQSQLTPKQNKQLANELSLKENEKNPHLSL